MHLQHLSGRKAIEHLKKKGKRLKGKHMNFTVAFGKPSPAHTDGIFVGTMASLSLHKNAVKRNRMRRRCREALRVAVKNRQNLPSCQLLITPRSSSLSCDVCELGSDAESFLRSLCTYAPK